MATAATIEESLEKGAKAALSAALRAVTKSVKGAKLITFRCYFLDDNPGEKEEKLSLPVCQIKSGIAFDEDGLRAGPLYDVPLDIQIATHVPSDPKRTLLAALYAAARPIIEAGGFTLDLGTMDAIAIEGGSTDVIDNLNQVEINCLVNIRNA